LANAALPLFPYCARLNPDHHRGSVGQLGACEMLAGDRMAAAEALNRFNEFRHARGGDHDPRISGYFASDARIDYQGNSVRPSGVAPHSFWLAQRGGAQRGSLFAIRAEGLTGTRVRITGVMERLESNDERPTAIAYRAPVEMIWAFELSQVYQIESITVGAWTRYGEVRDD
jgi:hypothetical protein